MSSVLAVAVLLGAFDFESFATLATFVGLPPDLALGYGLFLIAGTTVWPCCSSRWASICRASSPLVTGLWYATVISPGFALAFYTGQTGLELVTFLIFVPLAHWIYGLGLAGTITYLGGRRRRPSTGGGRARMSDGNGASPGSDEPPAADEPTATDVPPITDETGPVEPTASAESLLLTYAAPFLGVVLIAIGLPLAIVGGYVVVQDGVGLCGEPTLTTTPADEYEGALATIETLPAEELSAAERTALEEAIDSPLREGKVTGELANREALLEERSSSTRAIATTSRSRP